MQKVARVLNIESGEGGQVALILLQSFFIGTFMATFDVAANALFFTTFSGEDLGQAYAISAALGMALTYIYIKLQSWISFSKLAVINLLFISLATIAMRLGFEYTDSKELIYTIFLLQGPLNTLAIVGFWGLMGRIFNLRQGKRLFGLVDSGQIFGMIVICFVGPLLMSVLPGSEDVIIVSAIGAVMSFIMQIIISGKYSDQIKDNEDEQGNKNEKKKKKGIGMLAMIKNPYILMMVLFVMLAMISQFFIHYSYLITANQKYPDNESLTSFFFLFTGTVMIFTFAFKTFVFSKLMEMYGLKVNLLILPGLLIFFTILAGISGTFFGYENEGSGFQMFFLFIAVSKLFAQSLRMAIEVPAFKLLYQPLDKSIRYDVQAKIDGTVNEFSALIGGLVLMGLSLISFVTLIGYTYVLAIVIVAYMVIAVKLYSKYQDTLRATLNSFKSKISGADNTFNLKDIIASIFNTKKPIQVVSTLEICKQVEPQLYQNLLADAVSANDTHLSGYALDNIGFEGTLQNKDKIEKLATENQNDKAKSLIESIPNVNVTKDLKTTSKYLRSKKPDDKLLLLNQVCEDENPNIAVVAELLKDPNHKVRKEAIVSVGRLHETSLLPLVIENIADQHYRNVVGEVLLGFGAEMFEILDLSFYKSNFDSQTMGQIVDVFKDSKDSKAIPYLLKKINFPDQHIVKKVLDALKSYDFTAKSNDAVKVQQSIEVAIGIALWNMVALEEAKEYELPNYMINALNQEKEHSVNHIYVLLSLLYDQQSINNIRENIESGTAEGIGFAIELLDLFVAEELKPKLFPIFDDISIDDKIYKLELFYPIERLEKEQLLIQIINRDYNFINNWTKSCALYTLITDEDDHEIHDDYIAQLFNQDAIINQSAAWLIYSIDPGKLNDCLGRVDEEHRFVIDAFIKEKKSNNAELIVEKGLSILSNKWLSKLDGKVVTSLAKAITTIELKKGDNLSKYIDSLPLAIVKHGSIMFNNINVNSGEIFSDLVKSGDEIVAAEDSVVYVFEAERFYDLLYLYKEFLIIVVDLIDAYHNQEISTEEIDG